MAKKVGSVTIDTDGSATGTDLALAIYDYVLQSGAAIALPNFTDATVKATAIAGYKDFSEGLARAIDEYVMGGTRDYVDASGLPVLIEFKACELDLVPGGTPVFTNAQHANQGLAWVRSNGVANLFISVPVAGSSYASDERHRIVRFVYVDDGSTIECVEFSGELQIGHQGLSAIDDGSGNITLYSAIFTGDDSSASLEKGFTRIHWNGSSTSQSDVDEIVLLPDDDAEEALSKFNRVTCCVSTDGRKLVCNCNDVSKDDEGARYLLIYELAEVLAAYESVGDAVAIFPRSIQVRPSVGMEGATLQGIAATDKYIYHMVGASTPYGERYVVVTDYTGHLVRKIPVGGSLNKYTPGEMRDHPTQGTCILIEPEDITLTDDGVVLCSINERWVATTPIVTYEGSNYACRVSASGDTESPQDYDYWIVTDKAATDGDWSSSASYTAGSTSTLRIKEVYGIREAAVEDTAGEYQFNPRLYGPISDALAPPIHASVDAAYPVGDYYQIKAWASAQGEYLSSWELRGRAMALYDTRPGAGSEHFYVHVETRDGRAYSVIRGAGDDLADGGSISLYGAGDSLYPYVIRFYNNSTTGYVEVTTTAVQNVGTTRRTLGASDHPWISMWSDLLALTPTTVANLPAASGYAGAIASTTNGDHGAPAPVWSDGSNWYVLTRGDVASAS